MKLWINTLHRFAVGTYFVLTSLYCLLAFLPYTYFFLIKSPAYAWMPWFVRHQAGLCWVAAAATLITNWLFTDSMQVHSRKVQSANPPERREAVAEGKKRSLAGAGLLVLAGIYLSFRPFLPTLEDNRPAYIWSLAALTPLIAITLWDLRRATGPRPSDKTRSDERPFAYTTGLLVALILSVVYVAGSKFHFYIENELWRFYTADFWFLLWSLLTHFALAVAVLSVINLIFVAAAKTARPQTARRFMLGAMAFAALWMALFRFLQNALSFGGWDAHLYAATLALALTLLGFSLVLPFLNSKDYDSKANDSRVSSAVSRVAINKSPRLGTWIVLVTTSLLAIAFPYLIGGADWSGFFLGIVTVIIWAAVSVCVFRLRAARAQYSVMALLLVLAGSAAAYNTLEASAIFWSRALGSTDDEISLALEAYAGNDGSFQLARHILGNGREKACSDLCHILREYTNVRDTRDRADIALVNDLQPTTGSRPNIFVFVIDSMRPDYIGAYNPRADYTPNLDTFARDSIVFHRAYSQYAGTSLSEPAIWTGAMLLHAHYLQPFSRLNSLEKMAHVDDYHMIISMDDVLREILPVEGVVQIDADKKLLWNGLELGATVQQAEAALDARQDREKPVFFYTQPKNVHQFARNNVPSPASQHWQSPPGLNSRITYEVHWVDTCLGEFFRYLKQHGMYDNSIIIVTSDHGDATGEFGRISHSTSIWPEIMQVPLMVHLPPKMREHFVYDDTRISTLTDIAPTLYYLLGHRPIRKNPLYGRPLFGETRQELALYPDKDLLLASDVRAVYGILTADGRYLYATYDSPAQSYLFDLTQDPNARHSILTTPLKEHYDEEIIEQLQAVGDYYGYKPGVGSLVASVK